MATINYIGLTGLKRSVTGITLTTATVDTLITAIASDEGLPADYYNWSLLNNPGKNSIVYGDSSTKLSAIGLVDGDTVLCTPQQNESKQVRQQRKLEIAQVKRQAYGDTSQPYYRINNVYDISELPTQYIVDTVYDNPNPTGLIQGRPWVDIADITFSPNIYYYNRVGTNTANGYFADDVTFFNNPVVSPVTQTTGTVNTINISNQPQYNSIMYIGYLKAPATATFTFYSASDDASYIWIGPTAVTGFTTTNALVKNGGLHGIVETNATVNLIQNVYYPIRILFGNNSGPGALTVSYSTPSIAKTSTWTGLLYYNSATNGF